VSCAGCGVAYEREYYVNGGIVFGVFDLDVWMLGRGSPAAYQKMLDELGQINAGINLTLNSPLRYLNEGAAVGEPVEVNYHTYRLMGLSAEYYKKTGGAFNIAVQALSELWCVDSTYSLNLSWHGVPQDFKLPAIADAEAFKQAYLAFEDTDTPFGIEAYTQGGKYYVKKLAEGVKIDFGAIAKGYAVEVCMDIAKQSGARSAYVGIAGHNKIYGSYHNAEAGEETDFTFAVTHPRSHGTRGSFFKENLFATAQSGEASVIASGDYERFFYYGSEEDGYLPICHIIDPFSGMPIGISYNREAKAYAYDENAVVSAVIIDPSAIAAEAFATAACVYGFEDAVNLLKNSRLKSAVMTEQKIAFIGITEADFFKPENPDYAGYKSYGENIEFIAFE